ncbi:EscJ/YscJ/HrcJ family type III secretion inner membrane ring protein [Martelella alba]|uniref:Lipoprotein n=1 Tax=Martelella alba TaxID=2590451 RepID=A0A506U652_9HYPH|nr:type III secretion inner membrane ring lipoprotein SctJ [Martelella alba]TPW28836.1 EscJ/YscJ/HrcJ family type III secretion inner membrane ring protein [Martelella alba]
MTRRIAAIIFILLALTSCKEVLNTGLSESEANQILSTLIQYNVEATKTQAKDGTSQILVERSQFSYAVKLLDSFGLPKQKFTDVSQMFEKDGLVSSPTKEWAKLNFAQSQELASMIATIPGVTSAKVQIANPRQTNPFEEKPKPNVAVLVLADRNNISPDLVPQIKKLVSNSVDNIDYDNIGVVISPVTPPPPQQVKFESIAGISIASGSLAGALRLSLLIAAGGALLGLGTAAAGWFIWKWSRKRKENA